MRKRILALALTLLLVPSRAMAVGLFDINDKPEGMNSWLQMKDLLDLGMYDEAEQIVKRNDREKVDKTDFVRLDIDDSTAIWEASKEQLGCGTEACSQMPAIVSEDKPDYISDEWKELAKKVYKIPTIRWGGGQSNKFNIWNEIQNFYNKTSPTNILTKEQTERYQTEAETSRTWVENGRGNVLEMGIATYIKAFEEINPDIGFIFSLSMVWATAEDNLKFVRWCLDDPEESVYGRMRKEMGHPEPVNLIAIEMGNEVYFRSTAHEEQVLEDMRSLYCDTFIEHASLINSYYPDLPFSLCLMCTDDINNPGVHKEWNEYLLEHCGPYMIEHYPPGKRLISLHNYYGGTSLANSYKRIELSRNSCIKFFGENHGFKAVMSEHSKWATNYPPALTLYSALCTMEYLNWAYQWTDDFIWGGHYYGFYSQNLWATVRRGVDGTLEPTAISDAYGMYLDNVGDRVVESSVVTLDDTNIGNKYNGAYRYTACVFDKGDDEMKIIMTNKTENQNIDVTLNFKTGNSYKLIKEEILTAPNIYSFKFNEATNDIITRTAYERNEENFTHYLMPAYSMVVLTLKSEIKLPGIGERIDNSQWTGGDYFTDISALPERGDINFLASRGIFNGIGDGIFQPETDVTRAEFAAMLYRVAGESTSDQTRIFTDVASDAWYSDVIDAVVRAGYMRGTSQNTFSPEENITLAEETAALYRLVSSKTDVVLSEDADEQLKTAGISYEPGSWEAEGLRFAVSYDMLKRLPASVKTNRTKALNRAQTAALISAADSVMRK